MLVELNEKEYEVLKRVIGQLNEDTDDWDEDDLGLDMDRHFEASRHNYFGRSLSTKVADAQAPKMDWKNERDWFLGKLVRRFNMNYRGGEEDKKITLDTLRFVAGDDLIDMYEEYKKTNDMDFAADMLAEIID